MMIEKIMSMRGRYVVLLSMLLSLASCLSNSEIDDTSTRTVLVYMAGDNNLTYNVMSNMYSMNACIRNDKDKANLILFMDQQNRYPVIVHVHDGLPDTLVEYDHYVNTSDPQTLADFIEYGTTEFPAEVYGLVLWSHGTSWFPTDKLHFLAPNLGYAPGFAGASREYDMESALFEGTKSFGWEDVPGQKPSYDCMEISDMKCAIPDKLFDFIIFDACFMGSIEVLYELRDKADYFISSPYEILEYGMPYHIVASDMLQGNLMKICREFYDYYNGQVGDGRTGGISLVKSSELDSLARCFKKIMADHKEEIRNTDISKVQCFDRFTNHAIFDLEDFVYKTCPNESYGREFMLQIEKAVLYKASTPWILKGRSGQVKVDEFCGLSVYIPMDIYESSGLNSAYRETSWSIDTDY